MAIIGVIVSGLVAMKVYDQELSIGRIDLARSVDTHASLVQERLSERELLARVAVGLFRFPSANMATALQPLRSSIYAFKTDFLVASWVARVPRGDFGRAQNDLKVAGFPNPVIRNVDDTLLNPGTAPDPRLEPLADQLTAVEQADETADRLRREAARVAEYAALVVQAEKLKAAGLDEKSPAFQNCLAFLQRCQNRSESNDQAWAKTAGGGIYNPAPPDKGGKGKAFGARDPFASYGSMSYALLRCYILVGLPPEDPRVKAVQKWIGENYTVDENPGMGAEQKLQGLFYYYHAMAKALALLGKPTIALSNGTRAPWAKDLAEKILSLQGKDGSWVNTAMRWMENDKVIATSYAMLALSEGRQMLARPH